MSTVDLIVGFDGGSNAVARRMSSFSSLKRRMAAIALAGTTIVGAAMLPLFSQAAHAQSVSTLKAEAAAIAARLNAAYLRLQMLDEQYNIAVIKVDQLRHSMSAQEKAISLAEGVLTRDRSHLRQVAIADYVGGGTGDSFALLLSGNSTQLPEQQAYLQAASGNIDNAVTAVESTAHELGVRESQLRSEETSAAKAEEQIASARLTAQQVTNSLESTLSQVKGQLATAVAAAEAAQKPPPAPAPPAPPPPPPPTVHGGAGATAVRAAESQLGVPYVWGGATPGVGFDCSGLTMWSWAQAGVSLAHGATAQYYEIPHVSMSELQPGDLIFYGSSGYLYHVVMYVGSGPYGADTVIQAEQTGTDVMYTPIPSGAYGAGQP